MAPSRIRSSGMKAMPASTLWLSDAPVTSSPADGYLSGRRFSHAGQTFSQFALTIAGYACQSQDLAGMDLQVDPAQGFGAAVAHGVQSFDLE